VRRIVAAVALATAACGERQSAAEAARADSSAAGYAVGPRTTTLPLPHDTTVATASTRPPAQAPSSPAATLPALAAAKPSNGKAAATAATASGTSAASAAATRRDTAPNATTGGARAHGADSSAASAPAAAVAGPVRVNEFLTYDERSRTVSLQLVAGYNGLNGSLNYNGATKGNHGVYVPLGWRVHVAVTNHDSDLQHSAIVLEKVLPPPIEPTVPAFPGAALPQLDEGLAEDDIGTLDFVATRAGQYMIACGVPGHAQAGMWFQLAVLKGIAVPVYR
jgi:sulfocyanin